MDEKKTTPVFVKSRKGTISLLMLFALLLLVGLIPLGLERFRLVLFGAEFNLRSLILSMVEAGMVGGIADWYAVTCLFRSPFGIDSRHTRILPRKKNEIALGLTGVIKRFLPRDVLASKVQTVDYSALILDALNDPSFRNGMKRRTSGFLRAFLENVHEFQTHKKGYEDLLQFARRKDMAGALSVFLQDAVTQGIFESILPQAARLAENYIRANRSTLEAEVEGRIRSRMGWFLSIFVNVKGVQVVDELLQELARAQAPEADLIQQIKRQSLEYSAFVLQSEPDRALLNQQIHGFLERQEVQDRILGVVDYLLLEGIKFFEAGEGGPASLERVLDDMVTDFAEDVKSSERLRNVVNEEISAVILGVFYDYNLIDMAASWIRDEIQKLSDADFTRLVEEKLYNDLQFIRVSGAITGSLVGGLIYLFKGFFLR